jgi:hypothetical protein
MPKDFDECEPQGAHHVHERKEVTGDVGHAATHRLQGRASLVFWRFRIRLRQLESEHVPK